MARKRPRSRASAGNDHAQPPPAGRGRGVRRRELQRPRRGRRGARAGGVAGAAPRDRSADRRGRRPHLQVAGRRAAGRVHQPGRRDARGARRAGGGGRAGPHADTAVRLELRCAIHMGEVTVEGTDLLGDGINVVSRLQEHAPIGGVLVSAAVMDLIAGRIDAADRGAGAAQAAQHQPAGARLCRRALRRAATAAGARRRRSTASSAGGRRSPCCPSSTRTADEARRPRGSATGWSRTSSPRCRACPS